MSAVTDSNNHSDIYHGMQQVGVLVGDYGSQTTQLFASLCRKLGYYSQIINPEDVTESDLEKALCVIGSGGPSSVYEKNSPQPSEALRNSTVPEIDICLSFQLDAHLNKGKTKKARHAGEYGKATLNIIGECPIFDGLPAEQVIWMSHGDRVTKLPPTMNLIGSTKDCKYAAAWDPFRRRLGLQFHPEVADTKYGEQILGNFLEQMCGLPENPWNYESFINQAIDDIKEQVGDRTVVHLTSGGKDSTLTALLFKKAGVNVEFLHVKNGTERKGDVEKNIENLRKVGVEITVIDTTSELEQELGNETDAELKRAIIGRHYIRVATEYAQKHYGDNWIIGQGTIYPDHIESQGTLHSAKIKTHHNRVKEVMDLIDEGLVIEPNLYLFKDEVEGCAMYIAEQEGLPAMKTIFAKQHPFPGPGLLIRCLGTTGQYIDLFNDVSEFGGWRYGHIAEKYAKWIANEGSEKELLKLEAKAKKLFSKIERGVQKTALNFNYDANLLPIKSTGVQGDGRTYAPAAIITGEFDYDKLDEVSTEITNQAKGKVNRVVYAYGLDKVTDISFDESFITKERLDRLREADAIVMNMIEEHGLIDLIEDFRQCPTISIPVSINGGSDEAVVIRPFITKNFMTGKFGRLPKELVEMISKKFLELGYSAVLYDVSNKGPGTTEWE